MPGLLLPDGTERPCLLFAKYAASLSGGIPRSWSSQKIDPGFGCQNDQIVRVKGFGMPRLKSDARGDLFAHIAVEVPKKLSKRERELLEELAEEMGEDVNEEKRSPLQKLRDIFE